MKRFIYYASMVLGMSLLLDSCGGNGWMEGYWVNEDSSQYLFVKGDEVYTASRSTKRKKTIDYNAVKALFENKVQANSYTYKVGKSVLYDDIDESYSIHDIKIKGVNKESLYEEFPYIEETYSWESCVDELLDDENLKDIKLIGIEYCGEVDANLLFSDNKAKKLLFLGKTDYNSRYILSSFTKIKPEKTPKLSPEEQLLESWGELFDDNDIVVFDTELVSKEQWNTYYYYLFLHAYPYSDGMSEGTASICQYARYSGGRASLVKHLRFNYVFKNGKVYLKDGEWMNIVQGRWHKLVTHEMPLNYNSTTNELEGTIWFRDDESFDITAKLIDFSYEPWLNRGSF